MIKNQKKTILLAFFGGFGRLDWLRATFVGCCFNFQGLSSIIGTAKLTYLMWQNRFTTFGANSNRRDLQCSMYGSLQTMALGLFLCR